MKNFKSDLEHQHKKGSAPLNQMSENNVFIVEEFVDVMFADLWCQQLLTALGSGDFHCEPMTSHKVTCSSLVLLLLAHFFFAKI